MGDMKLEMSAQRLPLEGRNDLIGRRAELEYLRGHLNRLRAGDGRTVTLAGEPGIGKTRLIAALAGTARAAGIPVLTAHSRLEADLPASVAQAATWSGVLATVDDFHLVQQDQIPLAQELIQLTTNASVLLVLAYRERQLSPQLAALLSRATATDVLSHQRIGPLTPADTLELLGPRPDLDQIHRDGAGNPLYMKALAAEDLQTMTDAGTALHGELATLAEAELRVAQAAAVLGEPFHPELAAAVADLDLTQALDALDALTRLDLIRPVAPAPLLAFRHPVVRQIIYAWLEPGRRLGAHLRAAAELARLGASVAQRAHHVSRGAQTGRPEHVALMVTAAREVIHSAPATAAEWLATALTLIPDGDDLYREAQILLAEAHMLSGRAYDTRDLLHTLLPRAVGAAAEELASTVALAGRTERMLGRYAEAGALIRNGLGSLSQSHPPTAVALHTELADLALDSHDHPTALHHTAKATAIARQHGDRLGEVSALAQATMAHVRAADLGRASAAASAASELIDATSDSALLTNLSCLYLVGFAEATLERLADAERHLTRGISLSRRTGQTFILPASLKALGEVQFRLGRLSSARDNLEEAERLAEHEAGPATRAIAAAVRAHTVLWLRAEADVGEALALAEHSVAVADGLSWRWAVVVRCLHAELQLHAGDPQRCRQLLLDALGGPLMPRLTLDCRSRWCEVLTAAAIEEGDLEAAARWVNLAETWVEKFALPIRRGFAQRARLRLHAALGEVDLAASAAHSAVECFSQSGLAIEAGYTLVTAATVLRDDAHAPVEAWLNSAEAIAEQRESTRLLDQIRSRRRRLASQPQQHPLIGALAKLTDREREIAMLTSTGLTSVEIARKLYLSVRTVDSHLGRIYRKLGLSNRAGLTRAVLDARGSDTDTPPRGLRLVT